MDRRARNGVVDSVFPLAVLVALFFCTTRESGAEKLPEPLRAVGVDWTGEASRVDKDTNVVRPITLANAELEYFLYSSPQHPFLYEVSHYRITPKRRTGWFAESGKAYEEHEVVYWYHYNGSMRPAIRIFVKRSHHRWWSLWLLRRQRWEELAPGSDVWIRERGAVLRLWSVHVLIQAYGRDAVSLEF